MSDDQKTITRKQLIEQLLKVGGDDSHVALYNVELDDYILLREDCVEDNGFDIDLNFYANEDSQESIRKISTLELNFTFENISKVLERARYTVNQLEDIYEGILNGVDAKELEKSAIIDYANKYLNQQKQG